jgi:putative transposase
MLSYGNGFRGSTLPKHLYRCNRISAFLIDETMLQIGSSNEAWLWVVVVEPIHKQILGVFISRHRNMLVAEAFLSLLIRMYDGKHIVYSDGGTGYPETYVSLNLEHRLHSSYEKSIVVERTIEYLKDRTEAFDNYYYPCIRTGLCNLQHIHKWLILFVVMHNSVIESSTKFINLRDEMS